MATIVTGGLGGAGIVTIAATVMLTGQLINGRPCSFQVVLSNGLSSENINIDGLKATDVAIITPMNSAAAAMTQAYALATSGQLQIKSGGTSNGTEKFSVMIFPQPMAHF
jgi:hypothetical protein